MNPVFVDTFAMSFVKEFVIVSSIYREDGTPALKLYTNPKYFFELWMEDMQKNIEDDKKKKEKRKRKKVR